MDFFSPPPPFLPEWRQPTNQRSLWGGFRNQDVMMIKKKVRIRKKVMIMKKVRIRKKVKIWCKMKIKVWFMIKENKDYPVSP